MDVTHGFSKRQSVPPPDQASMPSLWIFLIIVLAILLGLVLGTSFTMHLIQRRQRRQLERRIANGEVDLEALGIKRLNVPQDVVDKMPSYTFFAAGDVAKPQRAAKTDTARHSTLFSQTSCAICLDDYVEGESTIRELPCNHIFHPDCIDPFLKNNSSLCPVCKRSALPPGLCPIEVTNVMVRRERLTRRMQESRRNTMRGFAGNPFSRPRVATAATQPGSVSTVSETRPEQTTAPGTQDTELGDMPPVASDEPGATTAAIPAEIAMQGAAARRSWRRQQLAQQHDQEFDQQGEAARRIDERRPWYRRWLGLSAA